MMKLVFCLSRLPHLSREEFQTYWRERHAPLVERHAATLRIQRYVQLHTQNEELNAPLRSSRGAPAAFDGIAELWWREPDDFRAATASEAGRRASLELLEDERRFIDHAASPLWFVEEHLILTA